MWSMRQDGYIAYQYAASLGFGAEFANVLDNRMCAKPENGLLKALYSTHPSSDDQIARLQELGVEYSRY